MRKLIATTLAGLTLAAVIALTPLTAGATGFEDSLDDCGYPKGFDALIMRPLAFNAMLGGGLLVGVCTISILCPAMLNRDYPQFASMMVVPAAKFAFGRRLGECGQTSTY